MLAVLVCTNQPIASQLIVGKPSLWHTLTPEKVHTVQAAARQGEIMHSTTTRSDFKLVPQRRLRYM